MSQKEVFDSLNKNAPNIVKKIIESQKSAFDEAKKALVSEQKAELNKLEIEKKRQIEDIKTELQKKENRISDLRKEMSGEHKQETEELRKELQIEQKKVLDERSRNDINEANLKKITEELQDLKKREKNIPSRIGKNGELEFEDWIKQFPHFECSEKLKSRGDFLITLKSEQSNGDMKALNKHLVLDVKKRKSKINDKELDKLLRDVKQRHERIGYLLVDDEKQMRGQDLRKRFKEHGEIIIIVGTREDFMNDATILPRYLELIIQAENKGSSEQIIQSLKRVLLNGVQGIENLKKHCKTLNSTTGNLQNEIDSVKTAMVNDMDDILNRHEQSINKKLIHENAKTATITMSAAKKAKK